MRSDQRVSGEEKNRCLSQNGRNIRWGPFGLGFPTSPASESVLPSTSTQVQLSSQLVVPRIPGLSTRACPKLNPVCAFQITIYYPQTFPESSFYTPPSPPQLPFFASTLLLLLSPPPLLIFLVFTSSSSSPASRSSPYLPPFNTACTLTPHHHGGRSRQSPSLRHRWH